MTAPIQIVQHNAVLATTPHLQTFEGVRRWALLRQKEILGSGRAVYIFTTGHSPIGGFHTVALLPDGNLEGYLGSDIYDQLRADFIERLAEDTYGDGSPLWAWIEVGWGDYGPHVIDSNTRDIPPDGFVPAGQRRRRD